MPVCSICGKNIKNPNSLNHIRSKYHQEKLKEKLNKKALNVRICERCGYELNKEWRFCPTCGLQLRGDNLKNEHKKLIVFDSFGRNPAKHQPFSSIIKIHKKMSKQE